MWYAFQCTCGFLAVTNNEVGGICSEMLGSVCGFRWGLVYWVWMMANWNLDINLDRWWAGEVKGLPHRSELEHILGLWPEHFTVTNSHRFCTWWFLLIMSMAGPWILECSICRCHSLVDDYACLLSVSGWLESVIRCKAPALYLH